ncbi:MAG TPA: tetratricopeptide repeat protein [Pirellulales bacterium]
MPSRFHQRQRNRLRFSLAAGRCAQVALASAIIFACGGCQMFRQQGPVPKSMAESRQLSQRGLNAMERGDTATAESLLAQAVKACPTDTEARRQYAEALWQHGDQTAAVVQMEKLLAAAPDDPLLTVRTGEMALAMGRFDDARRLANQTLDLNLNEPRAWALRGRVEQAAGQFEPALADFHRSLEFSHDDRQLLFETAELYRKLNRPQRSLSTLISLCETYGPGEEPQQVLYLEGLALSALSRQEDAADAYTLALEHGPATTELLYRLAEAQLAANKPDDCDRTLQQALTIDPNNAPCLALKDRLQLASRRVNQLFQQ